jgi:hypothetical protein
MKKTPTVVGLMQAVGLALYITLFATIATYAGNSNLGINIQPPLAIIVFLMAFIISASICFSIAFVYPIKLFFEDKKREAVQTILWMIGWLLVLFVIVAVVALV